MTGHRCTIVLDRQPCDQGGAYIVRVEDCAHEWCAGGLWCRGHPACVQHAAMIRSGAYQTDGPLWTRPQDLEVAHIANGAWTW